MNIIPTSIPDVLILEPKVFRDSRGFFMESWNRKVFQKLTGIDKEFVQDNRSQSAQNVLRGLHYQIKQPQGKLFSVTRGSVFDVAVDLRKSSSTFGKWVGVELSDENNRQIWIPEGFAHGFLVLSEHADCFYKTTDYYSPENERCLKWNDMDIKINWPINVEPVVSTKDQAGLSYGEAEIFP